MLTFTEYLHVHASRMASQQGSYDSQEVVNPRHPFMCRHIHVYKTQDTRTCINGMPTTSNSSCVHAMHM